MRYGKPVKVEIPAKIVKIASGYRHNLAVAENGNCYGWGYNNQQQLSHMDDFANTSSPSQAIFKPALLSPELEGKKAIDATAGEDFSLVLLENPLNKNAHEVFSTGNNLRGQLGINRVCHLADISLVEDVSGFIDQQTAKPLKLLHLQAGRRHAAAAFNYGAFFMWGDNEFGQLGDRKRRYLESPMPKFKFELRHNVENVICGLDSTAVIVEYIPQDKRPPKKQKEKKKRVIK